MTTDGQIPIETKIAYGIQAEGTYIYVGLGFRNGSDHAPTVAGVAFNKERLAEPADVQQITSLEQFKSFLVDRPRIPEEQVPIIINHFKSYF
jgi:hypothetical protein